MNGTGKNSLAMSFFRVSSIVSPARAFADGGSDGGILWNKAEFRSEGDGIVRIAPDILRTVRVGSDHDPDAVFGHDLPERAPRILRAPPLRRIDPRFALISNGMSSAFEAAAISAASARSSGVQRGQPLMNISGCAT